MPRITLIRSRRVPRHGHWTGSAALQSSAIAWRFFLIAALLSPALAQNKPANEKARWEPLIPVIEAVLKQQGSTCPGQRLQVGIKDAAELAGNSVALVDFCPGGAYTDWIVAMRLEASQPVPARFRKGNGKTADIGLAEGASVMHGMGVKLVAEKNAVYDIARDNDETMHLKRCAVTAYVWNATAKTFDLSTDLSKEAQASYCEALQEKLLKQR
jgi:hypothetical protein